MKPCIHAPFSPLFNLPLICILVGVVIDLWKLWQLFHRAHSFCYKLVAMLLFQWVLLWVVALFAFNDDELHLLQLKFIYYVSFLILSFHGYLFVAFFLSPSMSCIIKSAFAKNILSYLETFMVVVWWLVSLLWVSLIVTMVVTFYGRVHML